MITLITLTAIAFVIIFIATAIATANDELSFSLPVKAYAIRRTARNTFASLNATMAPVYAQQRNELAQIELSERCAKVWANLKATVYVSPAEKFESVMAAYTLGEKANCFNEAYTEEFIAINTCRMMRFIPTLEMAIEIYTDYCYGTLDEEATMTDALIYWANNYGDEDEEEVVSEPVIDEPVSTYKRFPYNTSCKRLKWAKEYAATQTELGYAVTIVKIGKQWYVKDSVTEEASKLVDIALASYFPNLKGVDLSTAMFNYSMSNLKEYDILMEYATAVVLNDKTAQQAAKDKHATYKNSSIAA